MRKFSEDRYRVSDGYKVTMRPAKPFGLCFGERHFYQSDFESMIADGEIKVYVDISDPAGRVAVALSRLAGGGA